MSTKSDCPPDSGHESNALTIANRTGARLIWRLIVCAPAGAILWKCCASDFSRCAAAHKMRLAVKSPCILAAVRCALSAFRGRAEQNRIDHVQCAVVSAQKNIDETRMGGVHVEGQFVSCRAGEPVYVERSFRSGENQGWRYGYLGRHIHSAGE